MNGRGARSPPVVKLYQHGSIWFVQKQKSHFLSRFSAHLKFLPLPCLPDRSILPQCFIELSKKKNMQPSSWWWNVSFVNDISHWNTFSWKISFVSVDFSMFFSKLYHLALAEIVCVALKAKETKGPGACQCYIWGLLDAVCFSWTLLVIMPTVYIPTPACLKAQRMGFMDH